MITDAQMARAQRNYDRQLPVDHDEEPRAAFDSTTDTEAFIRDLAACTHHSAFMFFEDMSVAKLAGEKLWFGGADILRELCRAWVKNPEAVYAVCGTTFFQNMKELAFEAWSVEVA